MPGRRSRSLLLAPVFLVLALVLLPVPAAAADDDVPAAWTREFPETDFRQRAVLLDEIQSGGPARDGIPAIDDPRFRPHAEVRAVKPNEPVLAVARDRVARAYPLQILMWHEIVNDTVAGLPVAVTFCPLCNSGIVFERRVDGQVLDFGTTGRLRNSDLIMYDRQTESWWQQFTGEAIVGSMTGTRLTMVPAATLSFGQFRDRYPDGEVLVPTDPGARRYGANPYVGYDGEPRPFLYRGPLPQGIDALARVVVVDETAYALDLIRESGTLRVGDLVFTHTPGMASALDAPRVAWGRNVGSVAVERIGADGTRTPALHFLAFAFAFHAFHPDRPIVTDPPAGQ